MDFHQKECPGCGDFITFTRKVLIFKPLPETLTCPTCGFEMKTTYVYRSLAFFFWTMRNYMVLGIAFMIMVAYVEVGLFDAYGFVKLPWFIITRGPIVIGVCTIICLLSSFVIQAITDRLTNRDGS